MPHRHSKTTLTEAVCQLRFPLVTMCRLLPKWWLKLTMTHVDTHRQAQIRIPH